jgi:hypothetical protein
MLQRLARGTSVTDQFKVAWKDAPYSGQGIFTWPDGSSYEGEWKDDNPHGKGVFVWPDGSKYEGEWSNGLPHGHGCYICDSGEKYDGTWESGSTAGDISHLKKKVAMDTIAKAKEEKAYTAEESKAMLW